MSLGGRVFNSCCLSSSSSLIGAARTELAFESSEAAEEGGAVAAEVDGAVAEEGDGAVAEDDDGAVAAGAEAEPATEFAGSKAADGLELLSKREP